MFNELADSLKKSGVFSARFFDIPHKMNHAKYEQITFETVPFYFVEINRIF